MAKIKWSLDPAHSEVTFKIKHLMISNVTGQFTKFDVSAETEDEDFTTAKVSFTADINSITTSNEQRDGHLKSDDFFNAEKFPQLKFTAARYENVDGDGSYELYGDLTIRDITKRIKLDVEFGGIVKDPWGNTRAGFSITGKINRKEFGLLWNGVTETGGIVVSDEVRIHAGIELVKQA
ncbi:MAG: YceI family protein [Bacteroidetes bacterium]|nr:YceI family protein [Bacteroidota bacterium]MBS1972737.1 YceI family protein [Bacteroidota bacterium]